MAILSTEVKVRLGGKNIKYYENLGYKIPRYYDRDHCYRVAKNSYITVKIDDLMPNTRVKIEVECDDCHTIHNISYGNYRKQRGYKENKYYCCNCAYKHYLSGENSCHWKFDKTKEEREKERSYPEYTSFIKKVLSRDNYTCQCCERHGGNLEVHHLDGYDWCKEKRTDVTNGITLCYNCHSNFHAIYGRGNNTKQQYEEWFGSVVTLLEYDIELSTAKKVYCIEENKVYNSADELSKIFEVKSATSIYKICDRNCFRHKTLKGKHLLWYDEYLEMTPEELDSYMEKIKRPGSSVRCITTNEIFLRITDAEKKYPQSKNISGCCVGRNKTSGKLPDGRKLQWEYYNKEDD